MHASSVSYSIRYESRSFHSQHLSYFACTKDRIKEILVIITTAAVMEVQVKGYRLHYLGVKIAVTMVEYSDSVNLFTSLWKSGGLKFFFLPFATKIDKRTE
jgi:hypothetical protein